MVSRTCPSTTIPGVPVMVVTGMLSHASSIHSGMWCNLIPESVCSRHIRAHHDVSSQALSRMVHADSDWHGGTEEVILPLFHLPAVKVYTQMVTPTEVHRLQVVVSEHQCSWSSNTTYADRVTGYASPPHVVRLDSIPRLPVVCMSTSVATRPSTVVLGTVCYGRLTHHVPEAHGDRSSHSHYLSR